MKTPRSQTYDQFRVVQLNTMRSINVSVWIEPKVDTPLRVKTYRFFESHRLKLTVKITGFELINQEWRSEERRVG